MPLMGWIGLIIAFLLISAFVIAFVIYRYHRELKNYRVPPIPDFEPIDPDAKPNMSQLNIISVGNLWRSPKVLGSGAFGIVYGVITNDLLYLYETFLM